LCITGTILITVLLSITPVSATMTARVAVLPFEISSGENMEYLKDTIRRELSTQLATKKGIAIIEYVAVKRILGKEPSLSVNEDVLRRVAEKLDAHFVVRGSMTRIGKNLSLDVSLFNFVDSPSFDKYFIEGNDLTSLIKRLVGKIGAKVLLVVDIHPEFQETELREKADLKEGEMVKPAVGTASSSSSSSEKEVIQKRILDWQNYWESKDIENYMRCYSQEFSSMGMDWSQWKIYKECLNDRYHHISLSLSDPRITLKDNHALVSFEQHYRSDDYSDHGIKSLVLRKENGEWKIMREQWKPL